MCFRRDILHRLLHALEIAAQNLLLDLLHQLLELLAGVVVHELVVVKLADLLAGVLRQLVELLLLFLDLLFQHLPQLFLVAVGRFVQRLLQTFALLLHDLDRAFRECPALPNPGRSGSSRPGVWPATVQQVLQARHAFAHLGYQNPSDKLLQRAHQVVVIVVHQVFAERLPSPHRRRRAKPVAYRPSANIYKHGLFLLG